MYELQLLVCGQPVTQGAHFEEYMRFTQIPHVKRISWEALGINPEHDTVPVHVRVAWDKMIPPEEINPSSPNWNLKGVHKDSVRKSLLRAISQHRPYDYIEDRG